MNPLEIPNLTKYINDFSSVFSPEQVESLSQSFINHESTTTEQVVTVFIPHRQGHELLNIGLKAFNENGIGQKNLNNGLLLIVVTEEKKLRIVVGKGLELKYTEMVCRDIVEHHLRPLLDEGKYEELVTKWGEIINKEKETRVIKRKDTIEVRQLKNKMKSIYFTLLFCIPLGIYLIDTYVSAGFAMVFLILLCLGTYGSPRDKIKDSFKKKLLLALACFIFFIDILAIAMPTTCSGLYCERSLFGYHYSYQVQTGMNNGSSYSSNNSSSSDWSSSDSSSSSFDGGGGSSNGGGYGD